MLRKLFAIIFLPIFMTIFSAIAALAIEPKFKEQDLDKATEECQDSSPCKPELVPTIDEDGNYNLALLEAAKPKADSLLAGWCPARHCLEYLNDGFYNNCRSWISAKPSGQEAWAEIDLGNPYPIKKIGFGSDHCANYKDRAAKDFKILVAKNYSEKSDAANWKEVYDNKNGNQVTETTYFEFNEVDAQYVRISVMSTSASEVRIDEIEIYGGTLAVHKEGKLAACWGEIKMQY